MSVRTPPPLCLVEPECRRDHLPAVHSDEKVQCVSCRSTILYSRLTGRSNQQYSSSSTELERPPTFQHSRRIWDSGLGVPCQPSLGLSRWMHGMTGQLLKGKSSSSVHGVTVPLSAPNCAPVRTLACTSKWRGMHVCCVAALRQRGRT